MLADSAQKSKVLLAVTGNTGIHIAVIGALNCGRRRFSCQGWRESRPPKPEPGKLTELTAERHPQTSRQIGRYRSGAQQRKPQDKVRDKSKYRTGFCCWQDIHKTKGCKTDGKEDFLPLRLQSNFSWLAKSCVLYCCRCSMFGCVSEVTDSLGFARNPSQPISTEF